MLDIFGDIFGSKSQGSDGQNGQLGWRWSILCLDEEFTNKFRSGECMDKVSWQSGIFFRNVEVCGSKTYKSGPRQPAGRLWVKNAQILKILRGQKWEVSGSNIYGDYPGS